MRLLLKQKLQPVFSVFVQQMLIEHLLWGKSAEQTLFLFNTVFSVLVFFFNYHAIKFIYSWHTAL